MARLLLILAFAAVVFWVFSAVDCIAQPAVRHRGVDKPVWIVIVLLFPVLGGVLWLAVGRASAASLRRQAPDDDPEFLRSLVGGATPTPKPQTPPPSHAEQERRIRDLEQELARPDADDDDTHHGRRDRR